MSSVPLRRKSSTVSTMLHYIDGNDPTATISNISNHSQIKALQAKRSLTLASLLQKGESQDASLSRLESKVKKLSLELVRVRRVARSNMLRPVSCLLLGEASFLPAQIVIEELEDMKTCALQMVADRKHEIEIEVNSDDTVGLQAEEVLKQHLLDDIEQEIRQRLAAEQESRLKARVASKILKKRRKKKRSKVVATAVAVIDQTEVPIDLIHTESNCICIYEECDDNGSKSADLKNEVEDDTDDHFDDDEDNDDVYGDDDCADEGNDDDDYSIDCNGDRFDNDSDNSDVAETKEEYIPWVDKPVCEIKEHQNVDKIPIPHYTDKYTEESNKESILSGNKDVAEKVKSGKSRRSSADKSVKSQKSYSHKSIKSISTKIVAKEESHAQSSDTQTYIQHHHLPQVLHHLRLAQSCLLQNDIDNISHHLKSALSLDPSDILTLTIKANYTYKFSNDSMEATEKMFSNALYKCLPSLYKSLVLMQCNSEVDSASGSIIDNFNLDTGDVEYDYRVCDIVYLLLSYTEFLLAIDQGAYSTMSVSKTTLLLHKCIQIQPTNNRAQELLEGISNIHIV